MLLRKGVDDRDKEADDHRKHDQPKDGGVRRGDVAGMSTDADGGVLHGRVQQRDSVGEQCGHRGRGAAHSPTDFGTFEYAYARQPAMSVSSDFVCVWASILAMASLTCSSQSCAAVPHGTCASAWAGAIVRPKRGVQRLRPTQASLVPTPTEMRAKP